MTKHLLDAVKTATDIHNGNYSSLRGKSFVTCDKMKKINRRSKHVKKPTLNQRIDKLTELMNSRFDNLEKRIDNIDTRLDYIVSANNLKDLPKSKSK